MRYHNITKNDMLNGDGLRVCLWVAGCSHGCKGCHNPITWSTTGGLPYTEIVVQEIYTELDKDYIDGITLTGGDPLHPNNRDTITALCKDIHTKYPTKTIWLYTGYTYDEIKDLEVISYVSVLVDGKFELDLYDGSLQWVGSSNQRVIDIPTTLANGNIVLYQG